MEKWGLVLEGGGMRGIFTSGVLDCFMDNSLYFPYCISVSAGACNGLSYYSKQKGRSKKSNIDMLKEFNYISVKNFVTKRNLIDFELLFDVLPHRIMPFDFDTFFASPARFIMVTTDCFTGDPVYLEEKTEKQRLLNICRASCSLPIACPIAYVDGIPMLDGGIADAIPAKKAFEDGCDKLVIVVTRNQGYRKSEKKIRLPYFLYRKYPHIREKLKYKHFQYNETLDFIEQLEQEGKAIIIRPEKPLEVGRTETDIKKLNNLYYEGYECASHYIEKLKSIIAAPETAKQEK